MMRSLKGSSRAVNRRVARPTRARLRDWFDTPLGRSLQAVEAHGLRGVLPSLYGTVALQLGKLGKLDLLDACIAPTRVVVEEDEAWFRSDCPVERQLTGARTVGVRSFAYSLPLDERSVDVALLPHTLDFTTEPHRVLREVSRVLRPEGHVVVLGFNPWSSWGLCRLFARHTGQPPWSAHFFRLARVKDWLALLDLEFTQGRMLYYRPPFRREATMDRFYFLEQAGDRWWPMMAAVYLIVAKKRVPGMTPLPVEWKTEKRVGLAAKPAVFGQVRRSWYQRVRRDAR
ncbi:MAG TPA: methyltransferase domain-containing protein [Burkholderiales bacterium]